MSDYQLYAVSILNKTLEELILQKSNAENLIAQNSSNAYEIITKYKDLFGEAALELGTYPSGFSQTNNYGSPSLGLNTYPVGFSQTNYGVGNLILQLLASYIYTQQQFGRDRAKPSVIMANLQDAAYGSTNISGASYGSTNIKKDY